MCGDGVDLLGQVRMRRLQVRAALGQRRKQPGRIVMHQRLLHQVHLLLHRSLQVAQRADLAC
jgi:hypothetical protein